MVWYLLAVFRKGLSSALGEGGSSQKEQMEKVKENQSIVYRNCSE